MTTDDGFIGLPPGMDAGAFAPPKVERQRTERAEVVFVPTVPGMPVPEVAAPTPIVPAVGEWRLVLADGSRVAVTTSLLIGRNPAPFDAWPGALLLPVDDTTQSMSKTHAAFEVDDSGLWVHDLNSTNGVWVVTGGDATEVAPGRRVHVSTDASVELGDYVLTITRDA
jgi:hypothetical protein